MEHSSIFDQMPHYWRRKKPCYWRRLFNHDYAGKAAYMITMVEQAGMPRFAQICNNSEKASGAWCALTPVGLQVKNAIAYMRQAVPAVRIDRWVVMPDHVHLVLNFTRPGTVSLGRWVGMFKARCRLLCAEGRLLVVGEKEYVPRESRGYAKNQEMNAAAASIATAAFSIL